jgi:thiosulfate/3-mercaptopyruvate sulfurtransferase
LRAAVEEGADGRIWDVRADDEWEGTGARGNARTGHIPGARHLEWTHLIEEAPAHRFLPLEEMRASLAASGIDPAAIEVVYCQSGIRAALGTFVLRLLGNDRARNYDGSMAEWANLEDTPLER